MVDANGTSTYDRYERIWSGQTVCVSYPMSKFLPSKMDGQLNTTNYIDQNITNINQK